MIGEKQSRSGRPGRYIARQQMSTLKEVNLMISSRRHSDTTMPTISEINLNKPTVTVDKKTKGGVAQNDGNLYLVLDDSF